MRTEHLIIVARGMLRYAAPESTSGNSPFAGGPLPEHDPGSVSLAAAPCLLRLVAVAGTPEFDGDGVEGFLARCYGVVRQRDWPFGPVLLAALGIDPGNDYWLVAEPVTLVAGHNDVQLTGVVAEVAADEATALIAALNAHFAGDGLLFSAPQPRRWFVRSSRREAIVTHPVSAAIGQSLRPLLPAGEESGKWRRWQDEIQMLLHGHPINVAREARGQPSINGIWFWGGGTRPPAPPSSIATWTNGETEAALGAYAGMPVKSLPARLDAVLAEDVDYATRLVALDTNTSPAVLEEAWLKPAWTALTHSDITTITLIADGESGAAMWRATRPSMWQRLALRFRPPGVSALAGAHPA